MNLTAWSIHWPLWQPTNGSPKNPARQKQTGLSFPWRSVPGLQSASFPQGFGLHRSPNPTVSWVLLACWLQSFEKSLSGKSQLTLVEWTAAVEWMASVAFGTGANGFVIFDTALGADTASAHARVDALQIEAGLIGSAFFVLRALGIASSEWVAQEIGGARANCPMVLLAHVHHGWKVNLKEKAGNN